MANTSKRRDYSLTGPENRKAEEKGLAAAEWYTCPIPRQRLKELMKRKDGPAIRDTLIWFAALIGLGVAAYYSWGTWWAIPAFFLYGVVYALPGNSRWHECGHGTAFKTPWMNEVLYQISSFMCLFPATPWRWSHARHHTDTIIVGRDPEIVAERPPIWRIILMEIFRLHGGPRDLKRVILHFFGKMDKEEESYIPVSERRKVCWEARVWVFIFLAVIASCVYMQSILPAMFIGLPTFYGFIGVLITGFIQHLGLSEDVLDHRLNTRTVYMNPIFRFLYWNMNYHVEHHMFPMVPYHALPALHEEMKPDCPAASPSTWAAVKEVFTALRKQRKDPTYTIVRPLPSTARPYRYGPHPFGTVAGREVDPIWRESV
ncbi:fatty acid desaturase family protein [Paenibacillus validus]|uniref:fatty acid desaturase family protein n=1 Tax=Paenibacillus validus TaxID=44253 RepID=UPI000FD90D9B|nr:fatty acid desaturase family protein [Paenibacillus validus]MED4599134.1 fatty acid desaturase family protein [Paenibacillus validus]MED4605417.1 fatty acid desaturase family protein [Paenibacillus validus]